MSEHEKQGVQTKESVQPKAVVQTEVVAHPKIGAGHADAMWRQGLRELRAAMYTGSNVAQDPEYGLYGTATPGEVQIQRSEDLMPYDPTKDSVLGDRLRQAEMRHDPNSDPGRDRDD